MSILISPPPFSILSTRRHVLVALSPQGTGAPKAGCLRVPSIICGNTTQRPPTVVLKPQRRHWNQFWPQQTDFSSLLRALLTPHSHSRALPPPTLTPTPVPFLLPISPLSSQFCYLCAGHFSSSFLNYSCSSVRPRFKHLFLWGFWPEHPPNYVRGPWY